MTKIIGIDDENQLRIPRGSSYRLRVRISDAAGGFADLTGRTYALRFYRGRSNYVDAPGVVGSDATGPFVLFTVAADAIDALPTGLAWEVGELLDGSKVPLFGGALYLAPAAPRETGDPAGGGVQGLDDLVWQPDLETVVVTPEGAPGRGPTAEEVGEGIAAQLGGEVAAQLPAAVASQLSDIVAEQIDQNDYIAKLEALYASLPPVPDSAPIVTGDPLEGGLLTASGGTFFGTVTSTAWQWLRDGAPIAGANAATYAPAAVDRQKLVTVQRTATNARGTSAPNLSTNMIKVLPSLPMALGTKVADFGHSFVINNVAQLSRPVSTGTNGILGLTELGRGLIPWVKALDGRFNCDMFAEPNHTFFPPSGNSAVSGSAQGKGGDCIRPGPDQVPPLSTTAIPGTIPRTPYLLSQEPGIVLLQIGTNDLSRGRTIEQLIGDYDAQVGLLTDAGVWVVLNPISWNSALLPGSDQLAKADALNDWIVAQAGRRGVKVSDTRALDGPHSGITTDYFYDASTHPADKLSRVKVRDYLLPILQGMVLPGELRNLDPLSGNLFPAAGFPGTGGARTSGGGGTCTGTVATGMAVAKASNASSLVCSKEAIAAGNEWQVITVNPVADATPYHTATLRTAAVWNLAGSGFALGDWAELLLPVVINDWDGWDVFNGSAAAAAPALIAISMGNAAGELYNQGVNSGGRGFSTVMQTKFPIPTKISDTEVIDRFRTNTVFITLRWRAAAPGQGVIKIGSPIIRKLASNPRLAWKLAA